MTKPVISLENVEKVYQMDEVEVHALRGINLSIHEGEFVSIMGPSGSGKSTMLHIIGCLDNPSSGKVFLGGEDVSQLGSSKLARIRGREIGFVFQFFNLYPTLNTIENVELPMMILDVDKKVRRKKAKELLESVGMGDRIHHLPSQLSGGQRQRMAIARALANDPSVLLADEPTGNLDSQSGEEILSIFKKLNEEGRTVVVVTHNQSIAESTEKIVKMKDGLVEEMT